MAGACARGFLEPDPQALPAVHRRYGVDEEHLGAGLRLEIDRVTWWRGFHVDTTVRRVARERAVAAR
jgi:hypothetical protein